MDFEDLKNPELQEKLKSAKTPGDILTMAKEEGFELSDDVLEGVSGGSLGCGSLGCGRDCPKLGVPQPIPIRYEVDGDSNVV